MKLEKILEEARIKGTRRKATLLIMKEMKKKRRAMKVCGIILFICMFCGMYCFEFGLYAVLGVDVPADSFFPNVLGWLSDAGVRLANNVSEWDVGGLPARALWVIVCYLATVGISCIGVLLGDAVVSFCVARTCKEWRDKDLTKCCEQAYKFIIRDYLDPVDLGKKINAVFCAGLVIRYLWLLITGVLEVNVVVLIVVLISLAIVTIILWFALWLLSGLPCAILHWKWLACGISEEEEFKKFWVEIDPVKKAEFEQEAATRAAEAAKRAAAQAAEYLREQTEIKRVLRSMPSNTSSNTSLSNKDHDDLDAVQRAMEAEYGPDWAKDI